eukprot:13232652-Alexandrium_andersonii.AAC.2
MREARGPAGRLAFTPQSPSISFTSALGTAQPGRETGPEMPEHITKSSQPPSEIRSTKRTEGAGARQMYARPCLGRRPPGRSRGGRHCALRARAAPPRRFR